MFFNLRKISIIGLILSSICFSAFAVEVDDAFDGRREDPDMDALRRWVRTKRMITVKEIGGDLSLSGEVRTEMQATSERKQDQGSSDWARQRGKNNPQTVADLLYPVVAYDIEVNLMLDYRSDRTWASIKLEFDNDMGQTSGRVDKISLERAYIGGRVVNGDTFTFDMEIGRRALINIYESRVEFGSLFDGVLFKLNKSFVNIGMFYFNGAVFLINDLYSHFGYVGEIGALDIKNTGLFAKYSFIWWRKSYSTNSESQLRHRQNLRYNYGNSQAMIGYLWNPANWKVTRLYLGGLYNHLANSHVNEPVLFDGKKENLAFFAGISIGAVKKMYDWALDVNYQWVEAQAVPDYDCAGIKRGNAGRVGLYTTYINGLGSPTSRANAVGSCNFKGWHLEFLYAITSNLTLFQSLEYSDNIDKNLGPRFKYGQYEAELIYAF
jgi:hypothetical protein